MWLPWRGRAPCLAARNLGFKAPPDSADAGYHAPGGRLRPRPIAPPPVPSWPLPEGPRVVACGGRMTDATTPLSTAEVNGLVS